MKAVHRLLFASLAVTIGAEACSCGYVTTCESLASAEVAFIGKIIQGTEPDSAVEPRQRIGRRRAVVSVESVVRGLRDDVREVRVDSLAGTSCDFELRTGERWLIFGGISSGDPHLVRAGGCSGSRRIRPEDTEISRMAASYLGGPNLFFGSVRIYKGWDSQWRNDNFLSGVEVKLAGARDWSARTGESGKFEVQGLPAGEYRFTVSKSGLSAELPAGGSSRVGEAPDKIVMPEHGCVETSLIMRPDTKISGTVRSVDGRPIAGIEVAAYLYDDDNHPRRARSATTGDDGRYVIQRLLAGRYAVGFSSESGSDEAYPSSFHPAAPTLEEATPVFISDRQSADWIDIIVLPKRKAIPIQVRVLWPDKRPVAMATILAEHSADGTIYADAAAATDSRVTDVNGFTTIRLYEGTEYTLSAIWQKLERKAGDTVGRTVAFHHANRIRLLAVPHATVTLTISERPDPIH